MSDKKLMVQRDKFGLNEQSICDKIAKMIDRIESSSSNVAFYDGMGAE